MHKNRLAPIVIAFSALAWAPLALSAGPQQGGPEHDHSHGQAAAATSQKPQNAQQAQRDAAIDAQIAHLRALHERLSRAKTPEERQALMAEQVKVMQESMATMRTMHAAMAQGGMKGGMQSGMQGGMGMGHGDMSEHMGMHHDMMVQHMELMQEMMQTMVDHMGMTGGGMMNQ